MMTSSDDIFDPEIVKNQHHLQFIIYSSRIFASLRSPITQWLLLILPSKLLHKMHNNVSYKSFIHVIYNRGHLRPQNRKRKILIKKKKIKNNRNNKKKVLTKCLLRRAKTVERLLVNQLRPFRAIPTVIHLNQIKLHQTSFFSIELLVQ